MKLKKQIYNHTRYIYLEGISILIPNSITWLAIDKKGMLRGYTVKPKLTFIEEDLNWYCYGIATLISEVTLEYRNWETTLIKIQKLKKKYNKVEEYFFKK